MNVNFTLRFIFMVGPIGVHANEASGRLAKAVAEHNDANVHVGPTELCKAPPYAGNSQNLVRAM